MKIIGITGGIGSGKSKVLHYLAAKGFAVYNADVAAKEVMQSAEMQLQLKNIFGTVIFENGTLNRPLLAQMVFTNSELLQKLNQLVHPAVQVHFQDWLDKQKHQKIVFKEAAILIESGAYKACDAVWLITASLSTKVQRVMQRDQLTEQQVLERVKNQWTDEQKAVFATHVISNEDWVTTEKQLLNLLSAY